MARVLGSVAGFIGLAGWLFALAGPTGTSMSESVSADGTIVRESESSNLLSQDLSMMSITFLLLMLLAIVVGIAGSLLRGRTDGDAARITVLVSGFVLLAGAVVSGFSIGLFLVPGALLLVIAGYIRDQDVEVIPAKASTTRPI